MASCIYDIENNLIVKAVITKYTDGERAVAENLINNLKTNLTSNNLFLFDRRYPSFDFFKFLMDTRVKFIIRTPINHYKCSIKASLSDQVFELKKGRKVIRLRAVRFVLSSGEAELLITNIEDENFGFEEFKILYFKRWKIIQTFGLFSLSKPL